MADQPSGIDEMRRRMERAARRPPPPRRPAEEAPVAVPAAASAAPAAGPPTGGRAGSARASPARARAPPGRPAGAARGSGEGGGAAAEPERLAADLPPVNLAIRVRRPLDERLVELIHQLRREGVRTSKVELIEMLLWELPGRRAGADRAPGALSQLRAPRGRRAASSRRRRAGPENGYRPGPEGPGRRRPADASEVGARRPGASGSGGASCTGTAWRRAGRRCPRRCARSSASRWCPRRG